jgi:hypothetical protein
MLGNIGKIIAGGDKKPAGVPWHPSHIAKLRDPKEAAYYLFASLEDAVSEKDLPHFFRAMNDVKEAGHTEPILVALTVLPNQERSTFIESLNIFLFNAEEKLKQACVHA